VSAVPAQIHEQIEALLAAAPFSLEPQEHQARLLSVLKSELAYAAERSVPFRRYLTGWPVDYQRAQTIAELPYLPVGIFKANPPLLLASAQSIVRTLASSATTGQIPSRVNLDGDTSKRMVKGVARIVGDFIGPQRRPYLVIDVPEASGGPGELGARGAAIQGLRSFATEMVSCLRLGAAGSPEIDAGKLNDFATRWRGTEALAYGFTYVVWRHFVMPLLDRGVKLEMPNVHLLHSGGWKRLQDQAVTREAFTSGVASVFGCAADRVVDFYGMVENVGVVYPDCELGFKHVPAFADVIVRSPLTLRPVEAGEQGLVQVCSVLPTSFPGFLVLTEDIAEVIRYDGCACGRRGLCFRFVKRVPKAEVRGCGNLETARQRPSAAETANA
jgi:phenylacetate-coenzyme A ligase PaaK-like adenylate-forming protein